MLTFDVITLFPNLFEQNLKELPFKKGIDLKLIDINLINLREYAIDKRGTVDDRPYGGGIGMLLRIEPLYDALHKIYKTYYKSKYKSLIVNQNQNRYIRTPKEDKIILLSPKGKRFNHNMAKEIAGYKHVTLICGRYEGMDARIMDLTDIEQISIGDFVLSGGELPALTIMEATTRLIPGILESPEALENETFTNNLIEYPQFTRPEEFNGLKVPEVLLSGDHKKIEDWKNSQSTTIE